MPAHLSQTSAVPFPPATAPALLRTARGPIEYVEAGQGPAVLAIHGAMGGHDQSLLLARTLGPGGFRYVAVSRPGYLGTPLSSGRTAEEQADLLAAALDTLGLARAAVLVVSGGGPAALQLALRHPGRCAALVLVSTCGTRLEARIPVSFHLTRRLLRWSWFTESMRRKAAQDLDAAASRSIPDPALRARTLADPVAGPLLRELLLSTFDRPALRLAGTENDIRVTRAAEHPLERVSAPTLVVHGSGDRVVPFRHARVFAERIPGAEVLALEGGDHVAIFTHHAVARARVGAFLTEHAGRAGRARL